MPPDQTEPARRYRGASSEQRRDQRRALLLEAAILVYGEIGYRRATVRSVCEQAGLTERYFYESFPNSETLLIAAYHEVNRRLLDELDRIAAVTPGGLIEKGRAGMLAYFRALEASPKSARVFLVELSGVSPAVEQAQDEALELFAARLLAMLRPSGGLPRPLHELLAGAVIGGISRLALRWVASDFATPIEDIVEVAMRLAAALQDRPPIG